MTLLQSTRRAQSIRPGTSRGRALIFLVGFGLACWFIARAGVAEIGKQLLHAGPRALWVLLPYALATAIGGLPWGILLPREARLRRLALVESRFAASSASSALPFFGLGGEPARLLWLAEPYRAQGTAALLVDRLLYNSANGCTLFVGALVGGAFTPLPASWVLTAAVLGWLTLGATLGLGWLVARHGVGHRAEALFVRLFGAPAKQANFGARVDAALQELIGGSRRRLLKGFLVHLVAKLVLALEVAVGLWSLGGGVDMARALVLAVVPIALSFFFSSVPGQLGIQEGTQTLVASALQLSPGLVLSMVVLQRFRQLVFMALLPSLLATAKPGGVRNASTGATSLPDVRRG